MENQQILLGVNIDHVATLRQARGTRYPSPFEAAMLAERGGADAITIHLREDRRHIQDADVALLISNVHSRINLELAVTQEMIDIALTAKPSDVCLVPEKRQELTTEGGLDVIGNSLSVRSACDRMHAAGIRVSLFIDPEKGQIQEAYEVGARVIEIHTGAFANASTEKKRNAELVRISQAAEHAHALGMQVNAGHGLNYHNVGQIARIELITELNIGHAIVARAIMSGLEQAVRDMKALMRYAAVQAA